VAKRKILIVNGDVTIARELEHRLGTLGYDVAGIASSANEAVAIAAQAPLDLAVMGMALNGDVNSRAAAKGLRQQWKLPVVFMIDESEEPGHGSAPADGTDAYVVKPFTDRELRVNIELAMCKRDTAKAVHELEDRFFAVSIDMLCFLDYNGFFKLLNPAWERTLGFTREELLSRPFIEFVHPDDRERTLKQNSKVRSGGQALAFENRYLCKDGSFRWFRWNAAADSSDGVIYSVARDVTEAKQADDDREQLLRELQAALAEVKTLRAILPICSYCRKIRDDENYWHTVEGYISAHTSTKFSHGICPDCLANRVESP